MKGMHRVWIVSVSLMMVFGLILVGCELFEHDRRSPTIPGRAVELTNYYGQGGKEGEMAVYVGEDGKNLFSVNVLMGSYTLWYNVLKSDQIVRGYQVDFKALAETTLCIGLLEDDILQGAVIADAAFSGTPKHVQGDLELYDFPHEWAGWTGTNALQVRASSMPSDGTRLYPNPQVATMEKRCKGAPSTTTPTFSWEEHGFPSRRRIKICSQTKLSAIHSMVRPCNTHLI